MSKKSNLERKRKKLEYLKAKRRLQQTKDGDYINPELIERLNKDEKFKGLKFISGKLKKKASATMLEYAAPLLEMAENEKDAEIAVKMALISWNLYMMPEEKRPGIIAEFASTYKITDIEYELIDNMMERKKDLFDEYNFFVTDHELDFYSDGSLNLSVVVAMPGE